MAETITKNTGSPKPRTPTPLRKPAKTKLPYPLNLIQSTIGQKWIMALTGIGLIGFVLAHMAGNLKAYQGPDKLHDYAEVLREIGEPILPNSVFLWILRIGLIAMFGMHIYTAMNLTRISAASSGTQYEGSQDFLAANYASRTMRWTGPIILLYLIWHLMDLTWGWVNPGFVKGEVYYNLENSLSSIPVALIYIIATVALAVHVYHGVYSLFASLGITNAKVNIFRKPLALSVAGLILVGNLTFPILTQLNVIDEKPCVTDTTECVLDLGASS